MTFFSGVFQPFSKNVNTPTPDAVKAEMTTAIVVWAEAPARQAEKLARLAYHGMWEDVMAIIKDDPSLVDTQHFPDDVTLLSYAVKQGRRKYINLLLDHGADPNIADINGNNALHMAAIIGLDDIVKTLLSFESKSSSGGVTTSARKKADPNKQNYEGATALHLAVWLDKTNVVQILHGRTNLKLKDKQNRTPWRLCKQIIKHSRFSLYSFDIDKKINARVRLFYLRDTKSIFTGKTKDAELHPCESKRTAWSPAA